MEINKPTLSSQSEPVSNRLGGFLNDWAFYGVILAVGKVFNLIQIPILASYLTLGDYGRLDYFLALSSALTVLLIFGQDSAVARLYFEKHTQNSKSALVSQSLAFQMTIYLCLVPVFGLGTHLFLDIDKSNESTLFVLIALIVQLPFLVAIDFSLSLLKWTRKKMRYLSLTVLYSSTQTIFIVFAVAYSAMSLNQLISTYVCCNVLFGVFSLWLIREQLIIPKKFNDLKDLIHVSAPVGLICIAIAASPIIERALVSSLSGHEALGEYGFATRFTLILWVVYTAFSNAWGPFAIRIYTRTSSIKTFNLILKILAVCACIFPFILVWFGSILVNYFDLYAYEGAVELIFPLALAVGVHAITSMLEFGIFISKNNFPRILVVLTSIIVLVLSVIFFARNYSALGVAWCVLVAATTRLLLTHVFSQRNYSMRWKITFLVIILGQAVLLGINQQLIHKVGEQSISGISVLAHTSIISMTAYFFLTKIDRSMMKLWIKRLQKNILVSCIAHKLIRRRV